VLVHVVDPSAYTPPYDHALCHALALAGADVELVTSRFPYGPVAHADDYTRTEHFYRASVGAAGSRLRMACKLAQHAPDMLRYRRAARAADVVHFQWLTVQHIDGYLLPRGRPLVLTAHDVMPREPRRGQLAAQQRLYERFDAVVVHSHHGRERLVEELGVEPERVHAIPHGAFTHLAEGTSSPLPFNSDKPVVLCFGLMRPYKGIDVLLRAWRGVDGVQAPIQDAELWIAGMPRMDISALREGAPPGVRWDPRFVTDDRIPGYFERADLVVLPYLQADQSGVLFTALAFGKPLLLSDVGGFPELAQAGAARIVPAGDARALAQALRELLADPAALAEMGRRARQAAEGRYSWKSIASAHVALYENLIQGD
jgi:glycosyltransferase involved in cell wall biosynthesis